MIAKTKTRAKHASAPIITIGGVKVAILRHPGKGTIPMKRLREAVAAAVAMRKGKSGEFQHFKKSA